MSDSKQQDQETTHKMEETIRLTSDRHLDHIKKEIAEYFRLNQFLNRKGSEQNISKDVQMGDTCMKNTQHPSCQGIISLTQDDSH